MKVCRKSDGTRSLAINVKVDKKEATPAEIHLKDKLSNHIEEFFHSLSPHSLEKIETSTPEGGALLDERFKNEKQDDREKL